MPTFQVQVSGCVSRSLVVAAPDYEAAITAAEAELKDEMPAGSDVEAGDPIEIFS